MLTATFCISIIGMVFGLCLALTVRKFHIAPDLVAEQIDRLLPQTQCGQCGYPGCRPYARAIASGEAEVNQCPPGGEAGIRALAGLLGREPMALNPENGEIKPAMVAVIDEQVCIGCTLCIQACPVDAILGASKLMHTVIQAECTGCELCLPPCPVDCIDMVAGKPLLADTSMVKSEDVEHPRQPKELPCINCGECARVCPAGLLPQTLQWQIRNAMHDDAAKTGLGECTECGYCNQVCPSHIPLAEWFRFGKAELRGLAARRVQAEIARQRFDSRQARLESIKHERRQHMEEKKSGLHSDAEKKRRIAAALSRVQARGANRKSHEAGMEGPDQA